MQLASYLIIFGKANERGAKVISKNLQKYQDSSRQKFNLNKSSIFFTRNTNYSIRAAITHILTYKSSSFKTKYLGLPTSFNRAKKESFKDLIEKINNKLEGWKSKLLWQTRSTMLISIMASSISSYQMLSFMLPKSVYRSLNKSLKNLLWSFPNNQTHKLTLKSWKSICQPKNAGGLGLRLIEDMNLSLPKTGWEMSKANMGLWHDIF